MPKTWAELPFKRPKPDTVIRGYIEAFDPDVLVQFSTEVPEFITASGITIVPPQDIWSVLDAGRTLSPRFGIGIFEVLDDIFEKTFRYKAKYPVKVILPQLPTELSLFWASVFGEIPSTLKPILDTQFREPLEIEEPKFSVDKLEEFMEPNILFPRRIAQYGLRHVSRAGFRREARAFFLDATQTEDVIDFWNLRALGQTVLAVPKQFQGDAGMKALLIKFLKAHRIPWPHNPKVHDYTSMVRSRNCTMEEMQAFGTGLTIDRAAGDISSDPFLSLQHWYPRIWDEWGRDKDGAVPDDLYAEAEQSFDIGATSEVSIRLKPALPGFR